MSQSTATLIRDFAKQHIPAPFWGSWGRFKLPSVNAELPTLLQSLFKLSKVDEWATQRIVEVDNRIGMRLALDSIHSTEFFELKFSSPSARAVETFDADARQLADMVRDCRDYESASCLGLAFAVTLTILAESNVQSSSATRAGVLRELHRIFHQLVNAKMIGDSQVLAFCQSVYTARESAAGVSRINLLAKALQVPQVFRRVIQMSDGVTNCDLILAFVDFLNACEENHSELDRLGFVEQLESMPHAKDIVVEIGKLHFQSMHRVRGLPGLFIHFRYPSGITAGTARAWRQCKSVDEMKNCLRLLTQPCQNTRIPYLSQTAQSIYHEAVRVGTDLSLNEGFNAAKGKSSRLANFLANVAGIDLQHKAVLGCFMNLVRCPKHLKLLLTAQGRQVISANLRKDASRANWVVATLVAAIGKFEAEEFSMISTCLCSGYLFDSGGLYCNPKTFRDFQAFIDSDILNLHAFLDPSLPSIAKSTGHVARLISYIRDFLVDPLNAHYTNFEIQRTKAHAT